MRSLRPAVGFIAAGSVLFAMTACGNQLPKEQLIADARGGAIATQDLAPAAAAPGVAAPAAGDTGASVAAPVAAPAVNGTASNNPIGTPVASGGSGAGGTKPGAKPASAPAKCTGPLSEIAIGTVGGQSGFIGAAVHGGVDAVKAWVGETNARGGLNCHPIKYYVADDGGDPAKNASLTQEMVEQKNVIAMLYSNNPLSSQGGKPVLEKAHVPTIGTEGAAEYFNTSPDFFPVAATGLKLIDANYATLGQQLTPEQRKHVGALTCVEASICSQFGGATGAKYAQSNGLTLVFNVGSTMVQPDYTSNCQNAKAAGVQALFVVGDIGMLSRTIRSCHKIDFKPIFASSPVGLAASAAELPDLEGVILGSTVKPWTVADPQTQRFLTALGKYLPGVVPGGATSVGWASALVFEKAAEKIGANPTREDIYQGLYAIKGNDFGGYMSPVTYAKGVPAVYPTCWWAMVIHDKKWSSPDGGKRGCHK